MQGERFQGMAPFACWTCLLYVHAFHILCSVQELISLWRGVPLRALLDKIYGTESPTIFRFHTTAQGRGQRTLAHIPMNIYLD